jgi:hypothetical protein
MIDLATMTPNNETMTTVPTESKLPLRRLACARCGAAFNCGAGAGSGCWCMDEGYHLPMPDVAGEDCLCPACLRAAAATRAAGLSA